MIVAPRLLLSDVETLSVADMETHAPDPSSDRPDAPFDADAMRAATDRLTGRLRSPWWFHALRGLSVGAIAFGIAPRADWAIAVLAVGLVGLVLLPRLRTSAVGFSSANPDRWRFVRDGAPWSVVSLAAATAGLVVALFVRQLGILEVTGIAVGVAVVVAVLGPLADRSARQRLARGLA
ncbi:hypothetical protein DOU02_07030 [Clavibacter michiganensis subsp. michiganensis]|nr:hypothetical protein DOU02_07030 [Clavibacter michiganensis subsp. michiganensis]OUD91611.1 hypothetical protein CMMCAS05_09285 [Clavibacter michiganensis subsp. michiganensis]OUE13834.1 hypothetical protein CMMCAY01_12590 [Clavibacter michiganensis subsp. michiganensis]